MMPALAAVTLLSLFALASADINADGSYQVWGPAPYTYDTITTFPQIAGQGAKGQWKLSAQIGDHQTPGVFSPKVNCSTPLYNACPQPALKTLGTGLVRINYDWIPTKTKLTMYNGTAMIPQTIETYMCYSDTSFGNRPWRKKNKAYPSLTQNCFFWSATTAFPPLANLSAITPAEMTTLSGSSTYALDYNDMLPTTSLFFMLWVRCTDGNVCAFESTESAGTLNSTGLYYKLPYNGTYITVEGYTGITPGLEAASIVLAIVGPVFFLCYYFIDHMYYTKTGKPLAW